MHVHGLVGQQHPAHEVPRLDAGRPVPPDVEHPEESQPAQQVQSVGAQGRVFAACGLEVLEERLDIRADLPVPVDQLVRIPGITGLS